MVKMWLTPLLCIARFDELGWLGQNAITKPVGAKQAVRRPRYANGEGASMNSNAQKRGPDNKWLSGPDA
jgi:hypothetical protein